MTGGTEGGLARVLLLTRTAAYVVEMLIVRKCSCFLHIRDRCFAITLADKLEDA